MSMTPFELFLSDEVQSLLDHFAATLDIRVTFFSADGRTLRRGRQMRNSDYCRMVQRELGTLRQCVSLDADKQQEAVQQRGIIDYQCHAGLREAIAPVFIHDQLAGFLMIGQFRINDAPPECMLERCSSEEQRRKLEQSFRELPRISAEKLENVLGLFKMLIDYIVVRELAVLQGDRLRNDIDRYLERHCTEPIRLPEMAKKQWRVGNIAVNLSNYGTGRGLKRDTVTYRDMQVCFMGDKPPVRPSVLYRRLRFRPGDLYSQRRQNFTQEQFNRLGTFRFAEFQYTPQDTLLSCDRLDLRINAAMDLPYDGELELNVTSKSNDQLGPGAVFNMSKKNVFRGGETFSLELRGSYEWQTNSSAEGGRSAINSYELGAAVSLDLPWIVFPWLHRRDFNFPAQTTFRLYGDQLNRAGFFKMLAFGGNATYTFQPTPLRRHTVTPFKLTFNVMQSTTQRFDSIMNANRALYLSLDNQFIPAMSYTYTYDDALLADKRNHLWWETSVTSAGNLTSCVYAAFGQKFGTRNKELMGNPFAQFLKLTSEVRYNYRIDANNRLAMRLMAGAIFSYGNAAVAPYSEQFFIGGANSIRAFTVRAVGPGSYHPEVETRYSYIDQTGDLKLEANLEYRFRIIGDLHGAVFMDAGNIWLLREDPARPGGQFKLSRFWKDIALGTGAGIRYDLSFLVVRFDVGVGLHVPYETSKRGYYNLPSFKRSLGYHLAIGYPF